MKVLVLNAGSSSVKFQLIESTTEESEIRGLVEAIGSDHSAISYSVNDTKSSEDTKVKDHDQAIDLALKALVKSGVINDLDEIKAIGHRTVHGGETFRMPTLINDQVMDTLEELIDLAPLHNPHNIAGIKACQRLLPGVDQYAIFDTAYHATIPKKAFLYGLPYNLYTDHKIRKYGFHGISHKYVTREAMRVLKEDVKDYKIISCHLGNGSSVCASRYGESVETSMGFTPLDGLMMGTRSGSFDPEIIPYLIKRKGYTIEEVDDMMNKRSGMMGISNHTGDVRNLREEELEGNEGARLALEMFVYRVQKFIGSHMAAMGGMEVLVFTGGIGEKAYYLRRMICMNFLFMGVRIDMQKNRENNLIISSGDSSIFVMVVPTNEELQIVREIKKLRQTQDAF
jgi:acetate kinase